MNRQNIVPKHVAIIMDGNRRWAKERKMPVLEGHRKVANNILEPLIEHAAKVGIQYLTLWAWSTENWKRDSREVSGIMKILRLGFKKFGMRMHKKGIRIRVIGDISQFEKDIRTSIEELVTLTRNNTKITVIFALNYGGRDEMIRAMNTLYKKAKGKRQKANVTEEEFESYLDTRGIPDPELIIRTGGEQRLSGFLLWQSEYSELYFAPWYMPEFTPGRLDDALADFQTRKRRFGG